MLRLHGLAAVGGRTRKEERGDSESGRGPGSQKACVHSPTTLRLLNGSMELRPAPSWDRHLPVPLLFLFPPRGRGPPFPPDPPPPPPVLTLATLSQASNSKQGCAKMEGRVPFLSQSVASPRPLAPGGFGTCCALCSKGPFHLLCL